MYFRYHKTSAHTSNKRLGVMLCLMAWPRSAFEDIVKVDHTNGLNDFLSVVKHFLGYSLKTLLTTCMLGGSICCFPFPSGKKDELFQSRVEKRERKRERDGKSWSLSGLEKKVVLVFWWWMQPGRQWQPVWPGQLRRSGKLVHPYLAGLGG